MEVFAKESVKEAPAAEDEELEEVEFEDEVGAELVAELVVELVEELVEDESPVEEAPLSDEVAFWLLEALELETGAFEETELPEVPK